MINFVTVRGKQRTHQPVRARLGPERFRLVAYEDLLVARTASQGTWVFSDFDRLRPSELREAVRVYRHLKSAGAKVLNDPARVLQRTALLKLLSKDGVNSFRAYRLGDGEWPDRYPVFIRGQSEHFGPLSELLNDSTELEAAIRHEIETGTTSLHDLIAVEYKAETIDGTRFRKLSAYRIGDVIIPGMVIINTHWRAKEGTVRIATEEDYARERDDFDNFQWVDSVRKVFDRANIEYGRVDFSIVSGRPEFYEINTNPTITDLPTHWSQNKFILFNRMVERYNGAMLALDPEPALRAEQIDLGLVSGAGKSPASSNKATRAQTFTRRAKSKLKKLVGQFLTRSRKL